ncbi:MAG: hypothetical protein QY302_01290 [Anaerolineales bacterium]|nr:MAG: hypothetical protein QY302_01290 [Anaerolineales bacterium]
MFVNANTNFQTVVEKTYQVFFSPPRYEVKARELEILARGENYRIPY